MEIQQFELLMDDGFPIKIYEFSDKEKTAEKAPTIIIFHGLGGHGREPSLVKTATRFVEEGYRIYCLETDEQIISVDIPEDLTKVKDLLAR